MTVLERRTYSPEELEDRLAPIVSASLLDRYYMATRYPDVTLPGGRYGEKEAKEALEAATAFFDTLERPMREWLAERE